MKFGLVMQYRPSLLERDKRVRPSSEQNDERSVARNDDSSDAAGFIIKNISCLIAW